MVAYIIIPNENSDFFQMRISFKESCEINCPFEENIGLKLSRKELVTI